MELTNTPAFEFDSKNFHRHSLHGRVFADFRIAEHFKYSVDHQRFRYYDALQDFLSENTELKVYLTLDKSIESFRYFGEDVVINIDNFIEFCDEITFTKTTKIRVNAFLGQHLSVLNMKLTELEKNELIAASLEERHLLEAVSKLSLASRIQEGGNQVGGAPIHLRRNFVAGDNLSLI